MQDPRSEGETRHGAGRQLRSLSVTPEPERAPEGFNRQAWGLIHTVEAWERQAGMTRRW